MNKQSSKSEKNHGSSSRMIGPDIYVTRPDLPPLDEFIPYLQDIWKSKILTNNGPFHNELEKALCEYLGVEFISLFTNCTIALITAMRALEIKGDVITTPYSFVATSNALLWNSLKPVFVDINKDDFNINAKAIEKAITPDTSAILAVHCYGYPCEMNEIQQVADKYDLKVIYDAAHAFNVRYKGESILKYGDLSVLSFHATKVFNTFEGGAIISNDEKTKQRIDQLKNFGFISEVDISSAGINGKMSEINAAFGLLQLKYIDELIERRAQIDQIYRNQLINVPGIKIPNLTPQTSPNFSYFPILVTDEYHLGRDELYTKMRNRGIYSRRYFYPLISELEIYESFTSANKENLPVANIIKNQIICLPIYPELTRDEISRVVDCILN